MEKVAPVDYPILDVLAKRWSPRAFASTPIPTATLKTILEAARWAPSCFNEQPWQIHVAEKGSGKFAGLAAAMTPGNQAWAPTAPVLFTVVASMTFAHNGKPNRHAYYDCGQAIAHLSVQATAEGLVLHQMGGFDREKVEKLLNLTEGQEAVALMAVGYPGHLEQLSPELQKKETASRTRKVQSEFVFGLDA